MKEILNILRVCINALDGDGSTLYLPDVTPADAAIWIMIALDDHGYKIVMKEE